jgi:tripartite-type tricarboxylate transporter receptor subunit TctC
MQTSRWLAGAAALLLSAGAAQAQLPQKLQILVGVAAGGPNDSIARMLSDRLRAKYGITAIVENRAGANGMLAANALIQSPPNGQTVMMISQGLVTISPHLSNMPFDPLKDLTPIAGFATTDVGFCIATKVPANNLKEFVAYAKQSPTPVTLGAAGLGNITHLLLERLKETANMPYSLVVYKGIAPSLQDVAGGHIDGSVCALVTALPLVKGGKMKVIGMFGPKRSKLLPDVPTTGEQGYPILDDSWYGIFGPPGLPRDVQMQLFNAFKEVAAEPETIQALAKVGFDPWIQDPEQLAKIMREESARWGKLIRENNIKAE